MQIPTTSFNWAIPLSDIAPPPPVRDTAVGIVIKLKSTQGSSSLLAAC